MSRILDKYLSKDIFVISFIFICLMIAFAPSYQFDYFRHDDWANACWDRVSIGSQHLFYNAVYSEFRPYTIIFLYYSELFTEYLSGAKIVKIFTIAILSFSSFILYKWLKIFSISSFFAIFLSVILFVLPPMQIMASSYHYFFMAFPVLLSSITILVIWDIQNKNYSNTKFILAFVLFLQLITFLTFYPVFILFSILNSTIILILYINYKKRNSNISANLFLYTSAFIIYFTAITAYPPSAMYIWFLLSIPLLMFYKTDKKNIIFSFVIKVFIFSILAMCVYFILGKFLAFILNIDTGHARGMAISGDLVKIFFHTLDAFRISSNLWDIAEYFKTDNIWENYNNFIIIFSLFLTSLLIIYKKNNYKNGLIVFISVSCMVFLTIAPSVASNNNVTMYRYLIGLSPLIGFLFLWSLSIIYVFLINTNYESYTSKFSLGIFLFAAIFLSNNTIYKHLVLPNQHEINFISNLLDKEIISKIKNKEKVVIHHIEGKQHYTRNRYSIDEYNVSMNMFRWPVLGSIVMLLKEKGIYTQSKTCFPTKWDPEHSVFKLNWGSLELFPNLESRQKNAIKKEDVLIDTGKLDFIN